MSLEQLENDIEQLLTQKKGNQQAQYQDLKVDRWGDAKYHPVLSSRDSKAKLEGSDEKPFLVRHISFK